MSGELSLAAAARVDLFDSEDAGSPLIECVVEGELLSEALARVATRVTQRPRIHWAAIPAHVTFPEYEAHRALCDSFRAIPFRVVAGSYVAVGLVDPSWSLAREAMEDLFGLPVRVFVLSYSDYIFITQPDLAPDVDDLDNAETWNESPTQEVVELLMALKSEDGSALGSVETLATPPPIVPSPAPDSDAMLAEDTGVRPPARRVSRPLPVMASLWDDDAGFDDAPALNDDDFAAEGSDLTLDVARSPVEQLQELVDTALNYASADDCWNELIDIFSLVTTAVARGVLVGQRMFVTTLRVNGAPTGNTTRDTIGGLLHRELQRTSRDGVYVTRLEPELRCERAFVAFSGAEMMVVTSADLGGHLHIFAAFGVDKEWRSELERFGAQMLERDDLWQTVRPA